MRRGVLFVVSAQAAELNMLSSWNTNYAGAMQSLSSPRWSKERVPNLTLDVKGPEAVSPFEQLEPVQAGLYQFVYTHTVAIITVRQG